MWVVSTQGADAPTGAPSPLSATVAQMSCGTLLPTQLRKLTEVVVFANARHAPVKLRQGGGHPLSPAAALHCLPRASVCQERSGHLQTPPLLPTFLDGGRQRSTAGSLHHCSPRVLRVFKAQVRRLRQPSPAGARHHSRGVVGATAWRP